MSRSFPVPRFLVNLKYFLVIFYEMKYALYHYKFLKYLLINSIEIRTFES